MLESEVTFSVKAAPSRVWNILSNPELVGRCVPMVDQVRVIRPGVAEWTLKLKLGPITKTIKLRSKVVQQDPPSHASFKGEGENLSLAGEVDLRALPSGESEVCYKLRIDARGSLAKITESVARRKSESLKQEIVERIRSAVE